MSGILRLPVASVLVALTAMLVACTQTIPLKSNEVSSSAGKSARTNSPWPYTKPADATISGSAEARARLGDAPAKVVAAIAERDFAKLARWIHPAEGLRLSPYAHVNLQHDVVLDAVTIQSAADSSKTYLWGHADGTGDPIELPIAAYFDRYVYAADFVHAPQVSYNKTIGRGNSINNARDVYADAIIVEYHFPYLDKDMAGLDWKSLRLLFRDHAGSWYLCAIIRDVWTI